MAVEEIRSVMDRVTNQVSKYRRIMGTNLYCQKEIMNIKKDKTRMNPMVSAETVDIIVTSWFLNKDRSMIIQTGRHKHV